MTKKAIIEKLREQGYRITRPRRILLDIILEGNCSCCKEIYYQAVKQDDSIGMATVYRMVHTLEEIGALNRNSQFGAAACGGWFGQDCQLQFEDGTVLSLSAEKWRELLGAGLEQCGYGEGKQIVSINFFESGFTKEKNSQ
jgi:Fur family ferric uptake transcriptional regulator